MNLVKLLALLFLCCFVHIGFSQSKDYLVRFEKDGADDPFAAGYLNAKGDTIVNFGEYSLCLNDTIFTFGAVLNDEGTCLAINNKGEIIYEIYWFDNGPDYLEEGVFRIIIEGKIGYANAKGEIVITPAYECAFPFRDGKARVSKKCEMEIDGEYTIPVSKKWIYIDHNGRQIK